MGEKENQPFQLSFNGLLKVDFPGSRVTSDGGPLLVRELDERLGLGKLIDEQSDGFTPRLKQEVPVRRSAAAVDLLAVGGLWGSQRRRTRLRRPDLSVDRLEEELGSRRSIDLQAPEF